MNAPLRLPGIAFETVPRPPSATLPRMDIAALVGFAQSGPLDLPVPVEDVARFRDVFGDDLPLAWDEQHGRLVRSYLGPSVAAFFRNGGRRAWIVRVAGEGIARREIVLPGVVDAGDGGPATMLARSPGAWAEALRVATLLLRERLPLGTDGDRLAIGVDGAHRLEVLGAPADLRRGDLIELVFGASGLVLHLFVDATRSLPRGLAITSRRSAWVEDGVMLPPALGLARHDALAFGSPPFGLTSAYRLRFSLIVRGGGRPQRRLDDLAFAADHPRFFGHLPADEDLFALRPGRPATLRDPLVERLRAEAADPRFPLAGREGGGLFLPQGIRTALADDLAEPPPVGDALEADGLLRFGPGLFLDRRLAWLRSEELRLEADHRYGALQEALHGLHALWPIEEATLLAMPDAVHRGWTREPALEGRREEPQAPVLEPVEGPDGDGLLTLRWTEVADATGYRLQSAADPDHAAPETHDTEATSLRLPLPEACRQLVYFRVRALRHGEVGPWSNGRAMLAPRFDFAACGAIHPESLALWLELASASPPGALELAWSPPADATIELLSAGNSDFLAADGLHPELPGRFGPLPEATAVVYYRVRARRDGVVGPWSNTVSVAPARRSMLTLLPVREYEVEAAPTLRALHRAVLRFAGARRDLLAVLSLPAHFREDELQSHLDALTPPDGGEDRPPEPGALVPPLAPAEAPLLGFGALYHPWLVGVAAAEAPETAGLAVPPDGAACGVIARRSLAEGAWIAPANQPLRAVLALEPAFDEESWRRLAAAQANLLRQGPRGFLVMGADTLARERELRPISVRRLMILLRRLALREGAGFVFEPNDRDFRDQVGRQFRRLLGELFTRGAFAGARPEHAFKVVTDESVNAPFALEQGRFVCELRVAPSRPLSFLTVRLVQSGPQDFLVLEA